MKKIKVSEAVGPALDWLVAKCEGATEEWRSDGPFLWRGCPVIRDRGHDVDYRPSQYWGDGGPIIEREGTFRIIGPAVKGSTNHVVRLPDVQGSIGAPNRWFEQEGPTVLIAAMRCFVVSRLGDEVEIPEGLA